MDLEQFFNKAYYSPSLAFNKPFMKRLAASMPGAISKVQAAQIGAGAATDVAGIRGQAGMGIAGIQETGATHRQNLKNAADIEIRKMMESGAMGRLKEKGSQDSYILDETDRLQTRMLRDFPDVLGRTREPDLESILDRVFPKVTITDNTKETKKKKAYDILPPEELPY